MEHGHYIGHYIVASRLKIENCIVNYNLNINSILFSGNPTNFFAKSHLDDEYLLCIQTINGSFVNVSAP